MMKAEWWEKTHCASSKHGKAGVALLIFDKIISKTRHIVRHLLPFITAKWKHLGV